MDYCFLLLPFEIYRIAFWSAKCLNCKLAVCFVVIVVAQYYEWSLHKQETTLPWSEKKTIKFRSPKQDASEVSRD